MQMTGEYPFDNESWPTTPAEAERWYNAAERWMEERGKRPLTAIGHRLWEIAARRETVEYRPLAKEFGLNHRGPRSVAVFSGILSEYCVRVMGSVFLSSIIVKAGSRKEPHPKGLPGPGGWWDDAPRDEQERVSWALNRQSEVWDYCSSHPNPFSP